MLSAPFYDSKEVYEMVSEEIENMVKDIHIKVGQMEQALRGYNGQPGLIKDHESLKKDYFRFKRWAIGITCFAVGSGAIGISLWQVVSI